MTPERFRNIVEAYGADSRRWPDAERDAARAWAGAHPEAAGPLLAEAADLDGWLGAHHVAPAGHALVEHIVATAPAARRPWTRGRLWWSGAAMAGVGALGVLAGALAMSSALLAGAPAAMHESTYLTTSFGGSTDDWSGE
ncbi:hypothetical protein [Burkholderia perseverans]|uniref:hypothetical protein n=1 Tax=Burkholderia perseverans TaxID=2615214 RepID=UPI001FED2CB5|nr:hypothetical protein [Burkholderia perseverans]